MNINIQINQSFVLHIEGGVATHNVAPVLKIIFLRLCSYAYAPACPNH